MGIMHLDPEAKSELHSEAEKLIARYDSPLETVKALMAYNCELETQIVALAHRHPGLVHLSFDDTPPFLGVAAVGAQARTMLPDA
ncbi:MAG: hypothetical protein EOR04_25965 [Mesorhizobium sp.]|uniref:hypothetical protein n=1 Tax=Mesorhizobium sp. TaxID=1871066 RepID=UPI000FE46B93|nr:hypothetical protein [Mesorhizobium sp.]RWP38530.1 MAG: hypothetical protein EOR04_25965 [Mesorhizobium sp.]